jgi:hypothetical protein
MRIIKRIGGFAQRYPSLQVGLLVGGSIVSAAQGSLVSAAIQGICAGVIACTIKRWF